MMYALNAFPIQTVLKAVGSQEKLASDAKRATEMADQFIKCVWNFSDVSTMRRLLAALSSASEHEMPENKDRTGQ